MEPFRVYHQSTGSTNRTVDCSGTEHEKNLPWLASHMSKSHIEHVFLPHCINSVQMHHFEQMIIAGDEDIFGITGGNCEAEMATALYIKRTFSGSHSNSCPLRTT